MTTDRHLTMVTLVTADEHHLELLIEEERAGVGHDYESVRERSLASQMWSIPGPNLSQITPRINIRGRHSRHV